MVVIYAEKHSLAKTIANVLKAGKRIPHPKEPTIAHWEFNLNGEQAIICHGTGHLASLVPAKVYSDDFKYWSLDKYPCIPEAFKIAPKSKTKTCFDYVKKFFDKADWLINATDPDREGELIFGYVYKATNSNKPWKRVWLEDLTDEKIKRAFSSLKNSDDVLPLQMAGRARGIADWLIGCNLTVAMTAKFGSTNNMLSVGRVQTPTLALIVNREKEIKNHKKTPFWRLIGTFSSENITFEAEYIEGKFSSKEKANALLSGCDGHEGKITAKEVKTKTENAPLLYNATGLQIIASKKFGWGSDKTATVMQKLYENKLMTYPRTSSEHLTVAMQPEVAETIKKLMNLKEYSKYALDTQQWAEFSKRHFDDKKVGSHTAIIPTLNVPDNLDNLSDDEKALYDLLVKSLLRIVYPKAKIEETVIKIDVNGNLFKTSGSVITDNGWYVVDSLPEKKKQLPLLSENQSLNGKYTLKEGVTEPPKRYTEATLLSAMELAGQNIEDEEAKTLMKLQKKGLGTDATRAPIIKSLFSQEYIVNNKKSIVPTAKGIYVIDTLPADDMKSAEITGEWEKKLNDIAENGADFNSFIDDIKETTSSWYDLISKSTKKGYISEAEKKIICPLCGKPVRKLQWGYSCSGYSKDGNGCNFSISNTICSKKITESQVVMLLTSGKTSVIKGFTAKSGNKFNAALKLSADKRKIEFDFANKK